MQSLQPVMQQALRPFAPAPLVSHGVSCKQTRFQSPYEWEFAGSDVDVVMSAANAKAREIDYMRSPAVKFSRMEGESFVITLRYYKV